MRIAIFILMTGLSVAVYSQQQPDTIIKSFFKMIESDSAEAAIDGIYKDSDWSDRIQDDVGKLKMQFLSLEEIVGDYYGYELIAKKDLLNTFLVYSYLVRYDRQPIRFVFEFYKPKDQWLFWSFSYDDKIDDELERALEIDRMLKD